MPLIFMKTSCGFAGIITLVGLLAANLLAGCSSGSCGKKSAATFMPGPVIFGGVEYYPAKPGATVHNRPVEYTTNPPPAGVVTYVTVISTNGIVIHLKEAGNSTNTMIIPDLM
jgi:hypothetical protein